jgi:hypothetical protein
VLQKKIIVVTLEDQLVPKQLPVSVPKDRNRVTLDRGDGRTWTPPPTARQLTAGNLFHTSRDVDCSSDHCRDAMNQHKRKRR